MSADTPVFMLSTASGIWTPLQKSDFEKWVNSTLEALGLDSSRPSIPSILSVELLFAERDKRPQSSLTFVALLNKVAFLVF